jgi:hypothetical protein
VFDRYSEKARRVIFFARYECAVLGGESIETEHLLFGLLREDKRFASALRTAKVSEEAVRVAIEELMPKGQKQATSVDIPLSHDAQRVLIFGAEEADANGSSVIDTIHLMLGLLRVPCLATRVLEQHGVTAAFRDLAQAPATDRPSLPPTPEPDPMSPRGAAIRAIRKQTTLQIDHLDPHQRLKRKPWMRVEALGHLVDLAATYHQILARALTESRIAVSVYLSDDWVAAQHYATYSWINLTDLWVELNRLIVHVLENMPDEKLEVPCRVGIEEPAPLLDWIGRYVTETGDLLGQILAKLD